MSTDNDEATRAIARALASENEDSYWGEVRKLQSAGTRAVFDQSARLVSSEHTDERRLGADVLAQLGYSQGTPFLDEALPLLLTLSAHERDAEVIEAVVAALGHQHDARAVAGILRHVGHHSAEVRGTVASALSPIGDVPTEMLHGDVVPALTKLMTDADPDVRNWATFALAHHAVDGREVRDTLFAAVTDSHDQVRGEAIRGLARRHDARVIAVLAEHLDRATTVDDLDYRIDQAAELMASSALLPSLLALRDRSRSSPFLDRAIANSDPVQVHHRATRLNELEAALAELGIAVSFSQDLFDPADVDEVEMRVAGRGCYDVDALLERAGRSAQRAARLVAHDLQPGVTTLAAVAQPPGTLSPPGRSDRVDGRSRR